MLSDCTGVLVSHKVTLHIVLTISATPGACLVPLELCVGGLCLLRETQEKRTSVHLF